jgi:hypothetical protein
MDRQATTTDHADLLDPYADDREAQGAGAEQAAADPELESILLRLMILEPGDHRLLASVLRSHPQYREQILAQASRELGNETVARALEELGGGTAQTARESAAPGGRLTREQDSVLLRVLILEPGDHELLAQVLGQHPEIAEQIIATVTPHVGEETVREALRIRGGGGGGAAAEAAPAPAAEATADTAAAPAVTPAAFDWLTSPLALEGNLERRVAHHVDFIRAHPELREQVLGQAAMFEPDLVARVRVALEETPSTEETPQSEVVEHSIEERPAKPDKQQVPGWVTRAQVYNRRHANLVIEFNELTNYACVGMMEWIERDSLAEFQVDPYLVAQWQKDHGVKPDGRVGAATVEAARQLREQGEEVVGGTLPTAGGSGLPIDS